MVDALGPDLAALERPALTRAPWTAPEVYRSPAEPSIASQPAPIATIPTA